MIIFAASQLFGGRVVQEDYFTNFGDECFVIADGVGGSPHGDVAARLASETAAWAYRHVRHRKFYWADKKLFLKRIFHTANLTVWQKQREIEYKTGLATTLLVSIIGPQNIWVGSVGDSCAYIYHEGALTKLTRDEVDELGRLTRVVGNKRTGLIPQIVVRKFCPDDCLVLATDGVTKYIADRDIITACAKTGVTTDSIQKSVQYLLNKAQKNNSTDNMTVCMVKRIEK
jgi:serine/threonine protein phosphatase PrpC